MISDFAKRVLTLVVFGLGMLSGGWDCLGIPIFMFTLSGTDSPQAVWACFLAFGMTLPVSILALWKRRIAGIWFIAVGLFLMYGAVAQRAYRIDTTHTPQPSIREAVTQLAPYADWLLFLGFFALLTELIGWPKPLKFARPSNP